MAKVHPNAATVVPEPAIRSLDEPPAVLTVWRKSLLFNCDGFTVFDATGNLAFRVDCYGASGRRRAEVVLMDVAGKPLLTIRRKRLSSLLAEHWVIYDGDAAAGKARPLLSVRRHVSLRGSGKTMAHVTSLTSSASFVVEGSYGRRACSACPGMPMSSVATHHPKNRDVHQYIASGSAAVGDYSNMNS
ncbi:unnamed protein product [Urochloa humidicola]